MCDMIKSNFIPPLDIRQLRDLLRFRMKLTNQIVGMKNRALNCLTVSNLKLDDVFSDVFGISSRSIIQHILSHPGETFDVTPFFMNAVKLPLKKFRQRLTAQSAMNKQQSLKSVLILLMNSKNVLTNLILKYSGLLNLIPPCLILSEPFPVYQKSPGQLYAYCPKLERIYRFSLHQSTLSYGLAVVLVMTAAHKRSNPQEYLVPAHF